MYKRSVIAAALAVLISYSAAVGQESKPLAAREKYFVIDSRVVASSDNAKLEIGKVSKHKANPLFVEDKEWEMRYDNLYGNIIYDKEAKTYKCWYSPFIIDAEWDRKMTVEQRKKKRYSPRGREMGICYATSKDGIKWDKPELGLMNYDPKKRNDRNSGDKKNNIVLRGPHGAGVFKDFRDPDPKRRYKTIYQGLFTSVSPDGLNWAKPKKCKGIRVRGDTHNNAFWAPTLGKYVGITRTWGKPKGRQVARVESDDFVNWTKEEVVLEGITGKQQTYAMPVFFRHNVYFGLIAIFDIPSNRVWTELAWSADTKKWNRVSPGKPLIPCSEKMLDYDYGCVYPCAYPVFLDNEIRLYYGGSDYLHNGWRTGSLCLATLRPDGFAGYEPVDPKKPATVTTQPIVWADKSLMISADAKGGTVGIVVLDENGKALMALPKISGDVTDAKITLPGAKLIGKTVTLKFTLTGAKLYAFSFGK